MRSCSHLILIRTAGGTLVAGMRIHQRALGKLPVEAALPDSPQLCRLVDELPHVVEFSGAVVCLRMRKLGLGAMLMRTALAAAPLLGYRTAVGFGHQHVLSLYARFGFLPDGRLPSCNYPDGRYQSRVLVHRDALSLTEVDHVERSKIRALRRSLRCKPGSASAAHSAPGVRR
ncbi:MAG: hypothetical protein MJE77_30150 [Proteobacteria bacterium]|nr:hypothetical protein [Pseudomonadota bacterium]